jgi:hypothetical protein
MLVRFSLSACAAALMVLVRVCGDAPQGNAAETDPAPASRSAADPARLVAVTFDDLPVVARTQG